MRKSSARNACKTIGFNRRVIALAVASCFVTGTALANPSGATVSSGTATISSTGSTLTVTNTPNAIINWHDFSINTGETTQFIQQSAASAVLNRITGGDPSLILGTLQSNGRVFLINPAGIVFGAGSVVDVAGLVASTLNITDADFLAGKHIYNANIASPGNVTNAGEIRTPSGGFVYLIGTKVENSGVITTPSGEAILAAGNSVEIVDSTDPSLRVTVSAQSQDVNLSQIMLQNDGNIFGVLNSGRVSANTVTQDATGRIYFKSAGNIETTAGSITEAKGTTTLDGGHIQAFADLNGTYRGTFDASGQNGGFVETSAGHLDINGIELNLRALDTSGHGGNWLLDPFDYSIGAPEAATISGQLDLGTNVTIDTASSPSGGISGTAGTGNITITSSISGSCLVSLNCTSATLPTFTLNAANDIIVGDGVSLGSGSYGGFSLAMNAGGNISMGTSSIVATSSNLDGNIAIHAGNAFSLINYSLTGGGTTSINAGSMQLNGQYGGSINSTGNLFISTTGNLLVNSGGGIPSTINTSSNLQMNIGGALTLTSPVTSSKITSTGTTNIQAGSVLADGSQIGDFSGGNVTITSAGAFTMQNNASVTSAGNVIITAGGAYLQDSSDMNANDIHLSGASLTASNGSEINADNNLSLISGGAIDLNSGISVDVTNSINISGGSLALNLVSFFEGRDITINLGGALSLTDAEISANPGNVTINAGSITETSGSSINGNNVQIASAGNVMLTDSKITSSGILSLTTGSLTETRSSFGAPSPDPTPSFVSISSGGNIVLNDGSDIVANNEISITTGGKIYLNSGTSGESHISTYSNNTIFLNFPTLFSGGFVLDGIEGIFFSPYNPFTGFFTGSTLDTLAILNQNLFITYGGSALAGIIGATNPITVATNPYLDPFGPNQTGPGDSSYTTGIFWGPTGDGFDQVRECS